MFTRTRRARPVQTRLCVETLEDRCLLSGNALQTTLMSDLTQLANAAAEPVITSPEGQIKIYEADTKSWTEAARIANYHAE